jgi:septum formation topological specificity factor MinE
MEIVKVVRKYYKVSENEIHITLEDQNAIDNG